jgi:RHS repeat-associated protein
MGFEQQDVLRGDFDALLYDMLMAKACNMNFLRLTQRPVQKAIYELCDTIGLMLQTDLPLFTVMRRTKFAEGVRQAEEMEKLIRPHASNILISYINEPYVTGGNPIIADNDVMFNDMLGNTVAINGKSIDMTAFGETENTDAMFTGKPHIAELGYTFFFRNYDSSLGKWSTSDPLGYPDGWNNFAYCNNWVTECIDLFGSEILVCREVVDSIVKHHWIEIHRDGKIIAAAGFYPKDNHIIYHQGEIMLGNNEMHIRDNEKDIVKVYRTSANQEYALMLQILEKYVPDPPAYTIYPPQYVCFNWTDDIADIIEEAWGLENELENVNFMELYLWSQDKISPNIDDIYKMLE